MAGKEAAVFIIDVGELMGECHNGRSESDLDWGMRYVWDKISYIVATGRKTLAVGVVGLCTDASENPLNDQGLEGYENISVFQGLGQTTMSSMRTLRELIQPSHTSVGDAVSAIIVAVQMIDKFTKTLKFEREIVLVTNALSPMDEDALEEVSKKINESNIKLTVIGIDFDDADYGFKEEDKTRLKEINEKHLESLVGQCNNGIFGTMAQAVEELDTPRIKRVAPFKAYDGPLTLGDPENYESALSIYVERYFKTKRATAPSTTSIVVARPEAGEGQTQSTHTLDGEDTVMGGTEFSGVQTKRAYKVNDPDAPGGKRDVPFDDLAKGYEYGSTAVPISTSDWGITKLETTKGLSILGFIPFSSYSPFLNMGESCIIVAKKFDEASELALSALINALWELESYAVARYVQKDNSSPQLLLLMPSPGQEEGFECLYDVPLPFAEDLRKYQFPPLDKVITVTGQVLTKHRLLPTEDLSRAMDKYVDAMDLSKFGVDDEGNPTEYAPIDESYNPVIHRINQAIRNRAARPDEEVGLPAKVLVRFAQPPESLVEKASKEINTLIEAAEVKKVPPKAKVRRGRKETEKPISGLDIAKLLEPRNKKVMISRDNAIPEFRQIFQSAQDIATVESAAKQMGEIIRSAISESFAYLQYDYAEECMRVMRRELIDYDEPRIYNSFVKMLKKSLLSGELGGDRRDMWIDHIVKGRLGLVDNRESEVSDVTEAQAQEFLRGSCVLP